MPNGLGMSTLYRFLPYTSSQTNYGHRFPPIIPNWSSASKDSSPFLNHVRAACRRRGYTYRTEKTDLRWIVRYVKYRDRPEHPRVSDVPCTSNLRASFRRPLRRSGGRGTKIRCAGDIGYTRMPGSIPILYVSDDPAEVGLLGSIGVSPPATGRPDTI